MEKKMNWGQILIGIVIGAIAMWAIGAANKPAGGQVRGGPGDISPQFQGPYWECVAREARVVCGIGDTPGETIVNCYVTVLPDIAQKCGGSF